MTASPPTPAEIKAIRETDLQVSISIFAEALGYPGGERLIQALEHGERNGKPFEMSRPTIAAMKYARAINRCMRDFDSGRYSAEDALEILREVLPVEMR